MGSLSDIQKAQDSDSFQGIPDNGLNGAASGSAGDDGEDGAAFREANDAPIGPLSFPSDGAFLAGATAADLEKGFTADVPPADNAGEGFFAEPDTNGDTSVGNPYSRGGFLSRPNGWER